MRDSIQEWEDRIKEEKKSHNKFRKQAEAVHQRWRDTDKGSSSKMNILYSNVEVMHGAIYAGESKPDLRRRFKDSDKDARELAEMMERALEYSNDGDGLNSKLGLAVSDYLAPGVGVVRLRYTPYFKEGLRPKIPVTKVEVEPDSEEGYEPFKYQAMPEGQDPYDIMDDQVQFEGEEMYTLGEPEETKEFEEVETEVVPWDKFGWEPTHNWASVNWIYFEHFLSRDEVKDQFGSVKASQTPFGFDHQGLHDKDDKKNTHARVYEVWDRINRKMLIFAEGGMDYLENEDDPLELESFYPMPEPLMANVCSTKLEPTPDYIYYQDQAKELDKVTGRIAKLVDALKVRGVYDSSFTALADLARANDNAMIGIDDIEKLEGKGWDNVFMMLPVEEVARVIVALIQQRNEIKQTIYEITGISDILRGATKSSETLGAQQLKQQNASARVTRKAQPVEEFIRELYRLKIEIMVEHFDIKTLEMMTGVDITPEMEKVMKNDLLRCYKIAVETDATVAQDAALEQKNRVAVLGAITQLLTGVMPFVQAKVLPQEAVKELLLFGIRGFKAARPLENLVEGLGQNAGEEQQQPGGLQPGSEVPPDGQPGVGEGIPPELMQQLGGYPQQ